MARILYGFLAMGWRGSARHWHRYQTAYLLLAGLATPLVVSVHSVVSLRFRGRHRPGLALHDLSPLFRRRGHLLGLRDGLDAVHSLARSVRAHDFITARHLDNMAKVMLATGMIVAYGYLMEAFMAWYSQNPYEGYMQLEYRPFGAYAHTYWVMMTCNVLIPQLLWFRRCG